MTKYYPVSFKGSEVQLKFNFGIARHLKDICKETPFTLKIDFENPVDLYSAVLVIVHAGLLNNGIKCTKEEVHELIADWGQKQIVDTILSYSSVFTAEDTSGEGSSDTQPGALNVA